MRSLLIMAWRNIWRNPRRTLLTVLAISFSVAVMQFFIGIQLNSYDAAINATISIFPGHFQIQKRGYMDKPQIRKSFSGGADLAAALKKTVNIKAASQRAFAFALASSKERSYGVQVIGVQPESEKLLSTIPSQIRTGRYIKPGQLEASIGIALARKLKLAVGDELTLLGQGRDGSMAATVVPVVGIFDCGDPDLNGGFVEMPLSAFQETFSMNGEAHAVVVSLFKLPDLKWIQPQIEKLLTHKPWISKDLVLHNWEDLLPGLKQSIEMDMAAGWLFYFSLILIVTFGVMNTFLMSVLERTREFGIMLALGTRPAQINRLVLVESFFLTLIGILIGGLAGSSLIFYFGRYGFSIPGMEDISKLWNLPLVIYPQLTVPVLFIAPVVIMIITMLSMIYPVIKLRSIDPAHIVRTI